jgi:hypothetical protein
MLYFYMQLLFVCILTFRKGNMLNASSLFRDLYRDNCSHTEVKEGYGKVVWQQELNRSETLSCFKYISTQIPLTLHPNLRVVYP